MTLISTAQPTAQELISQRIAHNMKAVAAFTKEIHRLEDEAARTEAAREQMQDVIDADRRVLRVLTGDI